MEKNEATREKLFALVPFESAALKFWLRKPKVRDFTAFLDLVRRCKVEQTAAGEGAEFDPAGLTDLTLVQMAAVDGDGAKVFTSPADVEYWLGAGEIVSAAAAVNGLIYPERPTEAR